MYTRSTIKLIRIIINCVSFLKQIPYKWNKRKKRLELITNKLHLICWYFAIITTWIHHIFIIIRCIQSNLSPDVRIASKSMQILYTITLLLPTMFHFMILTKKNEILMVKNGFIKYFTKIQSKF